MCVGVGCGGGLRKLVKNRFRKVSLSEFRGQKILETNCKPVSAGGDLAGVTSERDFETGQKPVSRGVSLVNFRDGQESRTPVKNRFPKVSLLESPT